MLKEATVNFSLFDESYFPNICTLLIWVAFLGVHFEVGESKILSNFFDVVLFLVVLSSLVTGLVKFHVNIITGWHWLTFGTNSLIICYWMVQNARFTAFTVSELRENQQVEGGWLNYPPVTQNRVNMWQWNAMKLIDEENIGKSQKQLSFCFSKFLYWIE